MSAPVWVEAEMFGQVVHMRRHSVMIASVAATAALYSAFLTGASATAVPARGAAGDRTVAAGGTWGKAIEVPRSGALNQGGSAEIASVSCASATYCAAGGFYRDVSGNVQAFVVTEAKGHWGKAIEVPGSGVLNARGFAEIASVSCPSAGNCGAGGFYTDGSGRKQALVVSEKNGRWGQAIEVPGSGVLNTGVQAQVGSVSCPSAGSCTAGGLYQHGTSTFEAFVVSERNGHWAKAIEVPGSGALNQGGNAQAESVSCTSAGNCAAGGTYEDSSLNRQAMVVSERNGHWGKAIEVPGSAMLNKGKDAQVQSVSCGSAGSCAATGYYRDGSGNDQALVVSEKRGAWGRAKEAPGSGALNKGDARLLQVSCRSAGNCSAAGFYLAGSGFTQALVVGEKNGVWGKARAIPGLGTLNKGGTAQAGSVSCASAGNCAAGGFFEDAAHHVQAFVVNERNGTWGQAQRIPGLGTLDKGRNSNVGAVSCGSASHCAAGGSYKDASAGFQAWVASET